MTFVQAAGPPAARTWGVLVERAEELWRAALRRPWTKRPSKADVEVLAAGVTRQDSIDGVYRISWATTSAGALAITSRALLIGEARPGRHLTELLSLVAPRYRLGPRVLAVPRHLIREVVVRSADITVHTDRHIIVLPAAAGANRDGSMERALAQLTRAPLPAQHSPEDVLAAVPGSPGSTRPTSHGNGLWSSRYLRAGRTRIERRISAAPPPRDARSYLESAGRGWRRLPRGGQWLLALVAFFWLQGVAAPAGFLFAVVLLGFLAVTSEPATQRRVPIARPEAELAEADRIEARVAGAACRAWEETLQEPSWSAPALAGTRASFDGDREVDAIIDLALRIHAARGALGPMPVGAAISIWQQQWTALDAAALRLGARADALIRHRDQAAALSRELAQLAELERLERSALLVDDLTIATSVADDVGLIPVADQIAAARSAVRELVELMTRTRAPLAEPLQAP
jgi:hypothetical protein